ncbi:unnamed protein product [Didymodactylos carnosus]|uniref:Uncharacterized protein n=1 Tax=Didymodactylos carnosus TaxID=1234261 RepID=A0A813V6N6_9BILA|nr:unnamed protein product [Didymodactylos carnosus]CAF0856679.1 unnamed protein product [Didymodactylos carnosus]CAF3620513.1 unnamed protein product [Didymodactylos carnosus]CAF3641707.1 unnamed protein product [Didymodactylos carnosus]
MVPIRNFMEINGLIGSLANRHQLASRIFHEYAFDALQESLQKLNDHVQGDCEKTKMVFDEAVSNHCSEHTKKELLTQVQNEWAKHQKLAVKEMKTSLSSYCHIALYNLRLQTAIIEKLQGYVDQLPHDNNNNNDANHGSEQRTSDINVGLPNFTANSIQTRQEIDTMLRIMLDAAPHELPPKKRNKFLDSLSSPEITQTTRNSDCLLRNQSSSNPPVPQHLIIPSNNNHPEIQASYLFSPVSTGYNGQHHQSDVCMDAADDNLPSYTDLFVVPGSCNDNNPVRQSSHLNNR